MSAHPLLADVIAALHSDLAEWMGTAAPPKVFDRFANALHDEFSAVTTVGEIVDRDTLLAGVWSARNTQQGLDIEISDVQELAHSGTLVTVRFAAENHLAEIHARRLVTAILRSEDHGYQWCSMHETAVPAQNAD